MASRNAAPPTMVAQMLREIAAKTPGAIVFRRARIARRIDVLVESAGPPIRPVSLSWGVICGEMVYKARFVSLESLVTDPCRHLLGHTGVPRGTLPHSDVLRSQLQITPTLVTRVTGLYSMPCCPATLYPSGPPDPTRPLAYSAAANGRRSSTPSPTPTYRIGTPC